MNQLKQLDANYPGGLQEYITNAKRLLEVSRSGREPPPAWPLCHPLWPMQDSECSLLIQSLRTGISNFMACREKCL